jgi:hypothetical protein
MPPWLFLLLGGGFVWYVMKQNQAGTTPAGQLPAGSPNLNASSVPSTFVVGQQVTVASNTAMFSDAALTQSAGNLADGGTMTVKDVPSSGISVGVVGPTGVGLGGGAPAYVSISAVSAAGTAV